MNIPRLQHLITVLEQIEAEHKPFYMDLWFGTTSHDDWCRTAACAGGYAALDPQFQAQGLGIEVFLKHEAKMPRAIQVTSLAEIQPHLRDGWSYHEALPSFEGEIAFEAAERFFDLTPHQATYIFSVITYHKPSHRIRPHHVIEHIQELLPKTQEPTP